MDMVIYRSIDPGSQSSVPPTILIELKTPKEQLNVEDHVEQIVRYCPLVTWLRF